MWIVIEKFPEPFICVDSSGNVLYFNSIEEAEEEANDCQDGKIVEL